MRNGIQRYKCNDCNKKFQSKRRTKKLEKSIFKQYIYKRQTLQDLANKYKKSIQYIHYKIKAYEPHTKFHKPRVVNIIYDATFYGKN